MKNVANLTDIGMNQAFSFTWMDRLSLLCSFWMLLLSTIVMGFNHYVWHYPLVNYFVACMTSIFCLFFFSTLGFWFGKGSSSRWTKLFFYITVYHSIVFLVMYATNAVQLTPFKPIDIHLLQIDSTLHYDTVMILNKLAKHASWRSHLVHAYNFVDMELAFLPVLLVILGQFYSVKQFFCILLCSTLLGYLLYFFWPTTAPASLLKSTYFIKEQIYTGVKFYQLHGHIKPEFDYGGLISMPSFHIIWAILCQQSAWRVRWLWYGLLPVNILVVLSALFLGWHYLADFFGSVIVIAIAAWIMWYYKMRLFKKYSSRAVRHYGKKNNSFSKNFTTT